MKRFFCLFVMAVIFTAGLFAEAKVTEEQLESFEDKGNYIKAIILRKNSKSIDYYNKQAIFEILLKSDGTMYIYNDNGERVSILETEGLENVKLDSNNNLILTYRF